MAEKISWNFVTSALNGPNVSGQGELKIDAYDKIGVTIIAGATQAVNLAPSGTISFLVINPAVPDVNLTYKGGGSAVALDGPHVLIGTGAVSMIGGATTLTFTNGTAKDAVIEIMLGRDATP